MDLNAVTAVLRPRTRSDLAALGTGETATAVSAGLAGGTFLAGGTWLFSEPQPGAHRLVDLTALGWTPLAIRDDVLSIAATCTIADLNAFEPPPDWRGGGLIRACCRAFLASFKVWNMATVGGNICLGLPAGPMISLVSALEGEALIWAPDGTERRMPVASFVRGPLDVALGPGEVLRAVEIPVAALRRRAAFRRASLTPLGRSGVLLIGTRGAAGDVRLTITAATRHPVVLAFDALPDAAALEQYITSMVPDALYYDDVHGRPDWRRHMTRLYAREIRAELAEGAA
ncbi:FAD binding domain-containing protein [Ancylobacter radicis]|uniref:FAD binding domain-containing protein n=1 Tax=Ancylobacter radicis TaxID=2836179 RepID=A0ABS5R2X1_9HYPH|nr:FAD binding domain-containing protein [Ancylobacter radicis]MBS9475974.1 FAD binding domain-containing protein [Ancylobacter radicis]